MTLARPRRLLRLLGLGPLTIWVLYHLWEHTPIRHGRQGVLARLEARFQALPPWLEAAVVLAPLALHAGLGLRLAWLREDEGAARAELRRHQRGAAVVLAGFLLWHVGSLWAAERLRGATALAVMERAEAQLASLPGAIAYALGWSAFAVHFATGLVHSAPGGQAGAGRATGLAALLLGLLLWLWGMELLAAYTAGAGLASTSAIFEGL